MSDTPQTQASTPFKNTLDTLLAVSLSYTVSGKVQDNVWATWQQICEFFLKQANTLSSSKDGLLICFAHFAGDYRLTSIGTDIFAVCLDFDHGTTEQLLASLALAQRLSTRGIMHTTWSDSPVHLSDPERLPSHYRHAISGDRSEDRCWRVIIPLDVPVAPAAWADIWARFATVFASVGATADPQCKNINRRYYVPMAKQHVDHPTLNQDGSYKGASAPSVWTWGE